MLNSATFLCFSQVHGLFEWKWSCGGFLLLFYIYLLLKIQLLRCKCWNPIKRFNPTTYLCLSQGRTCIFNAISWSFLMLHDWKWDVGYSWLILIEFFTFTVETMLLHVSYINSQTCISRPPLGQRKCGLLRQVTS